MKNEYIKLPIIKEVEVKGYELYKLDWKYEFKKGLNLFLGGNTLGKTTSVYIMLYGIAGIPEGKIDFFTKRIKSNNLKKVPVVSLKLEVNSTIIEIERNLANSSIINLSIDDEHYYEEKDDLKQIYEDKIISLSGLSSLEDYRFLLERLLIREEEGSYLLWRTGDQARILRLLFGYEGLDKQFAQLEKEVTEYDTKMRGQKDTQFQFKKRLKAIREQKTSRLEELEAMSVEELENRIQSLEKEKEEIIKQQERLKKEIGILKQKREATAEKVSVESNKIEELESKILNLENEFFESIYSDPKILLARHKLEVYGICMFCNQKLSAKVRKEIIHKTEQGSCPVCESQLPIKFKPAISKQKRKIVAELEPNRKELLRLKKELENVTNGFQKKDEKLNKLQNSYFKITDSLSEKITEIDDSKLHLVDIKKGEIEDISIYDRDIKNLHTHIEYYQKEAEKAKVKYKDSIEKLKKLNEKFEKGLNNLQQDMVKIFQKYAGALFVQCNLDIQREKPRESKIRLPVFLPKINNTLRKSFDQVSKCQAIFLEYAFRMTLCELYNKITGHNLNLIIETSEGIFDIVVIETLSNVFANFSRQGQYLLIVSNLGREDFLEFLIKKYKVDIKQRMVNFFDIGRLSKIQRDKLSRYKKAMNKIITSSSER